MPVIVPPNMIRNPEIQLSMPRKKEENNYRNWIKFAKTIARIILQQSLTANN